MVGDNSTSLLKVYGATTVLTVLVPCPVIGYLWSYYKKHPSVIQLFSDDFFDVPTITRAH